MKTMPSSEFRKTFARLEEPVAVTSNGHTIGSWTPLSWNPPSGGLLMSPHIEAVFQSVNEDLDSAMRAFRPVPKPGKGR